VRREDSCRPASRDLACSDLEIPLTPAAAHDAASSERLWQPKMEARRRPGLAAKNPIRVLEVRHRQRLSDRPAVAPRSNVLGGNQSRPEAAAAPAEWQAIDNVTLEQGDAAQGWPRTGPTT